jgi:uncharacterized protein (DUF58 family)
VSAPRDARPPLKWRARAFLLVGAGTAFLLLAVLLRSPVPVFVAVPFLFAPVAAGLNGPSAAASAPLRWLDEGSGRDVRLTGVVMAEPAARCEDWVVRFDAPRALPESAPPLVERRPDGLRFTLRWTAPEPTVLPIPPPSIVWQDPLGVVERTVAGERSPITIERYPPELLRLGSIRLKRTLLLPGETRSHRLGSSGEFFGIRAAAPTDPPRRINWAASARVGRLLANDYELDRGADLLILIDLRPTGLGPAVDSRLLGISRAAAQGIADSCLREKLRVGFATFGEFVESIPLSTGRLHRARIHRAILATRSSKTEGPSERCAVTLRRAYPSTLTTLLLSPLVGESAVDLVPYLRLRGFPVIVLSPSPLPLSPQIAPLSPEDEAIAARLGRLERRRRLADAWLYAPVVDWEDYWSLAGLVQMMKQPAVRRGQ